MLMSSGLTISTLHSHHHLEWHHVSGLGDTGHCISEDTTVCPISGYLFETDVLSSTPSAERFFHLEKVMVFQDEEPEERPWTIHKGRAPPFLS